MVINTSKLQEVDSTPASENVDTNQDGTGTPDITAADIDTDLDFSLTKKKKKRKKPKIEDVEAEMENGEQDEAPEGNRFFFCFVFTADYPVFLYRVNQNVG